MPPKPSAGSTSPEKSAPETQSSLSAISARFSEHITALRLFAEQVGPLADQQDEDTLFAQLRNFLTAMGMPVPESFYNRRKQPASTPQATPLEPPPPTVVEDGQIAEVKEIKLSQTQIEQIVGLAGTFRRQSSQHGKMLRTSALMLTVSLLDALFADLLGFYYVKFPKSLDGQEHTLTFKELCELGSIEVARDSVLNRKVESVLRLSCRQQLAYFAKTLKVDLTDLDPYLDILDETIQRRHVWVHNAGRASKLYLANVAPALLKQYGAVEGEELPVDHTYLRRAIDRVNLAGVVISQQCWRAWQPDDGAEADDALMDNLFDTLCDKRYVAAQYLGKFACKSVKSSEAVRRNAILNYAQSFKWTGKQDDAVRIVDEHDWSSCSLRYQLAQLVIRDDVNAAIKLLPLALRAEDVTPTQIREWPIFQKFRADAKVQALLIKFVAESPGETVTIRPKPSTSLPSPA